MVGFVNVSVNVDTGIPSCECGGSPTEPCDHLDATLLSGELAMVHPDDIEIAEKAVLSTRCSLFGAPVWKRDWLRDHRWRGLPLPEKSGGLANLRWQHGGDYEARPKVCFTGHGEKPRDAYLRDARERGWRAVDSFQPDIKVMVAADPAGDSSKLKQARKAGVPVVSYAEWERLSVEGEMG